MIISFFSDLRITPGQYSSRSSRLPGSSPFSHSCSLLTRVTTMTTAQIPQVLLQWRIHQRLGQRFWNLNHQQQTRTIRRRMSITLRRSAMCARTSSHLVLCLMAPKSRYQHCSVCSVADGGKEIQVVHILSRTQLTVYVSYLDCTPLVPGNPAEYE